MARSLIAVTFLVLTFVAIAYAWTADLGPFGSDRAPAEARQDGHWGAGWQAVMPSRLIAIDVVSL